MTKNPDKSNRVIDAQDKKSRFYFHDAHRMALDVRLATGFLNVGGGMAGVSAFGRGST